MKRYTKKDLTKKVLNLDGTPATLPNADGSKLVEYTVADAFRRSLNASFQDENNPQNPTGNVSFEKKMERYEISKKIFRSLNEKHVDLKTEEQSELKKCVGKYFYNPEPLGFLNEVMESVSNVPDEPEAGANGTAGGRGGKNRVTAEA